MVDGVLSLGQIHDACVWREAARLLLLLLMGFIGCMEITDSAFGVHSIGFQLQRTLSIGIRYGLRLSQFQWKKNTIQAQQSYICPTFFRVGGMPKLESLLEIFLVDFETNKSMENEKAIRV